MSISPRPYSDDELEDCSPIVTKKIRGHEVYPRSTMSRKPYDFQNVPPVYFDEPGSCENLNPGCLGATMRSCIRDLEGRGLEEDRRFLLMLNCPVKYSNLLINDFQYRHNCVMVFTPLDVVTIHFLRLFKKLTQKPILALLDYDPMSLKLLSFFESWKGGNNGNSLPGDLADVKLDIKWLGLRDAHVRSLDGATSTREVKEKIEVVEMDEEDVAAAEELLNDDFVKCREEMVEEVKRMIRGRVLVELPAVNPRALFDEYLPSWIEKALA